MVVGVFIGIQVANWNQERTERIEEQRIVLRLIEEAEQSKVKIKDSIESTASLLNAAKRVHKVLLSGGTEGLDIHLFQQDLMELGPWYPPGYVTATLDQSLASGAIDTIRSFDLRDTIANYQFSIKNRISAIQNVGYMNLKHTMIVHDSFDLVQSGDEVRIITPVSELFENIHLRRRVGQFIFTYKIMKDSHQASFEVNEEYSQALEQYASDQGWLQ